MKICPFISHMLGDDNATTLTIESGASGSESDTDNVVILGFEEGKSSSTATKTKPMKTDKNVIPSHLLCMKEACRFYKSKTGDCQFDLIFSMLEKQQTKPSMSSSPDLSKEISEKLSNDIDKIWKFQTQSVAELVKSLAESEKSQSKMMNEFKTNLDKKIDGLPKTDTKAGNHELTKKMDALQKSIEEREGSIENLTTTVSDIVLDLRQNFNKLQAHTEDISKQLEHSSKSNNAPSADITAKLDETLKAQKETADSISSWRDKIMTTIQDLQRQQKSWETRMDSIAEYQEELLGHMEDGRKHRESQQARRGKKDAKKFNNLGVTSFHNGAYEMARDQFLQAVEVEPEFAEAFNNLGLAYTELNAEDKASEAFKRALEIAPSLHAAYSNLGYIFFRRGNYDEAVEMYNEALGRSTNNSSAYTNLGNAYYKMGKTEEAHKAWSQAVEIDPSNEKAKKNLQRIREETK